MCDVDKSFFVQIINTTTDGGIPLAKFYSKATGLTVCIAKAEGPIIAGYLCVATEAFDDDGLPHTLEHLVFLGSEKYPYKGVLDILANRCLASGTNAWTDTDHTCYTMKTTGSEGFLKLLPIYVDHLLYPLLTDSAFLTEVHHVDSDGEDNGIVYCEMQARENSAESRCHLAMLRAMFPGHCGYKSETGGLIKNLRESTTNEKVRAYHKQFYRPENLCIIIVGQISAKEVFKSLQCIEEKVLQEEPPKPFIRPWESPVPPLEESTVLEVAYPCEEEQFGIVIASWRGPEAKDYSQLIAVQVLMDYLTETSISPLQRDFVESADPYCNQVDYTVIENSVSCIYLHFANVPVEKLKLMKKKLLGVLEKIANGTEQLDMKRMKTMILKKKLYILTRMESSPHNQLAMSLIGDFLYGSTLGELHQRVRQLPIIEGLLKKDVDFWKDLLRSYMVDGKYVFVLGNPSPKLAYEMTTEEAKRTLEQQERLGAEGLKKNAEILAKAVAQNNIPAPDELISSISIPSIQSIKFHPIRRSTNCPGDEKVDEAVDFALEKLPCRFQLDDVKSNFVQMYAFLDTVALNDTQRLCLPLFVELIIESPVFRNGELVPCHEVMKQLAEDTISVSSTIGFGYNRFSCGFQAQVYCLKIMVEEECYLKGIQWMHEILFKTEFEVSKIKTIATKMISDVARLRRNGTFISKSMMKNLCFNKESNHWSAVMMRQQKFLMELLKTLASDPDKVIGHLHQIRELLTASDKMTIHLAAHLPHLRKKIAALEEPWITNFLPTHVQPSKPKSPPQQCSEMLKEFQNTPPTQVVIGISAVESSFLIVTSPCFNTFTHPDYAALLVVVQYLQQIEGPLYKQIRGLGLSYSYGISVRPNEGLIYLLLFKSTLIVRSYKEAYKIIESYLTKQTPWDTSLLESACSSLIFEIISEEETVADVVNHSIHAYYKKVDAGFTKTLLENILKVTPEDMERVGIKYLKPLFDPDVSRCTVCCHPSKVNSVVNGFVQFRRQFTVFPSLDIPVMSEF